MASREGEGLEEAMYLVRASEIAKIAVIAKIERLSD
jgi:hypothetical protein